MSGSVSLAYKLFGHDVSASKAIKGVGKQASGLGKSFAQMGKVAGGAMAGIGLASLGRDAIQFGKDSMAAFAETGSTVLGLQRVAGGTAEEMSHLAAAAKLTGTDTSVLQKSIGILAKNMAGPGAKAFAAMGVATKDSQGHLRNFASVMPELADKFAAMPAGADKTALALKLFGKQGLSMLPILNKGSKGLAEMAKASDEAGTTLSGPDLEAVKANNKAKRQFTETVQGLQIAIGRNLYPVITTLMNYMKTSVMPIIKSATAFFLEHKEIILKVAGVVGVLAVGVGAMSKVLSGVAAVIRIVTAVQAALNFVMAMNPIGLVVLAVIAFIAMLVIAYKKSDTFRRIVDAAWTGIKAAASAVVSWFTNTAWPMLKRVIDFIVGYYRFMWNVFKTVVGFIIDKGGALISWFVALPGKVSSAVSGLWDGLKDSFRGAINWIIDHWNNFSISLPSVDAGPLGTIGGFSIDTPNIPRLAAGGIVRRSRGGTLALLGEGKYDERVTPLDGRSSGTTIHLHLNGPVMGGTKAQVGRALADALDETLASRTFRSTRLATR